MGVIVDDIDFDEYHKIKKKLEKESDLIEKSIKKISPADVLHEIESGATYNLRESIYDLKKRAECDNKKK